MKETDEMDKPKTTYVTERVRGSRINVSWKVREVRLLRIVDPRFRVGDWLCCWSRGFGQLRVHAIVKDKQRSEERGSSFEIGRSLSLFYTIYCISTTVTKES